MPNLFCVDDFPMHLSVAQMTFKSLSKSGINCEIIGTAVNGQEGFEKYKKLFEEKKAPDIITLDIRMPILDGLSALVKIKALNPSQKVIMVSSEDDKTVSKSPLTKELTETEKLDLIQKVAARVKSGVSQSGKINQILQACDELHIDPIVVAKKLGASGYLHKPYDPTKTLEVFTAVLANKPFLSSF